MLCALSALLELSGWRTNPGLDSSPRQIIGRKILLRRFLKAEDWWEKLSKFNLVYIYFLRCVRDEASITSVGKLNDIQVHYVLRLLPHQNSDRLPIVSL